MNTLFLWSMLGASLISVFGQECPAGSCSEVGVDETIDHSSEDSEDMDMMKTSLLQAKFKWDDRRRRSVLCSKDAKHVPYPDCARRVEEVGGTDYSYSVEVVNGQYPTCECQVNCEALPTEVCAGPKPGPCWQNSSMQCVGERCNAAACAGGYSLKQGAGQQSGPTCVGKCQPGLDTARCCVDDCTYGNLAGKYSCGDRISWLTNHEKQTKSAARAQVASQYPQQCGKCDPAGATDPCIGAMLEAVGTGTKHTCQERMAWLNKTYGSSAEFLQHSGQDYAQAIVASQFPTSCGKCNQEAAASPCLGYLYDNVKTGSNTNCIDIIHNLEKKYKQDLTRLGVSAIDVAAAQYPDTCGRCHAKASQNTCLRARFTLAGGEICLHRQHAAALLLDGNQTLAIAIVASQYPAECGACNTKAAEDPCMGALLEQTKRGGTCLDLLRQNGGIHNQQARAQVAREAPAKCGRCDLSAFHCTSGVRQATCWGTMELGWGEVAGQRDGQSCDGNQWGTYGCEWKWSSQLCDDWWTTTTTTFGWNWQAPGTCGVYKCQPKPVPDAKQRCLDARTMLHDHSQYIVNENRGTARAACGKSRDCECCEIEGDMDY